MKNSRHLCPQAIDTFRATILADRKDLGLPRDLEKWVRKLKESCKALGCFTLRVDFQDDECTLGILSSREALDDEPEALYIRLTIETIGQLISALKLAKKELRKVARRRKGT